MQAKTIKLTNPVTYNNKTYIAITVNPPKVKDLKNLNFEDKTIEGSIKLVSSLAKVPELAIEEMAASDFIKTQEVIADFFTPAPKTTKI